MPPAEAPFLTPADVARRLRLKKLDGVYALIRSGALAAVNVSPSAGRRCWRISPEAFAEFLRARQARPAAAVATVARRRARTPNRVTAYF